MKKILIVSPSLQAVYQFRKDFLELLREQGREIWIVAPPEADVHVNDYFKGIGVRLLPLMTSRAGVNPWREIKAVRGLRTAINTVQPDLIFAYAHKGILYSALALLGRNISLWGMLPGLGVLFSGSGGKKRWVRQTVGLAYRLLGWKIRGIFFLNRDDREDLAAVGALNAGTEGVVLPGEGVNLEHYAAKCIETAPLSCLLIARLLREKGVGEYLQGGERLLRDLGDAKAQFHLLGALDENPASLSREEMDAFLAKKVMNYHGQQADVRPFIEASNVFVLPSYYREGLPRSIMEAMSMGRAIVTTNSVGCRETVFFEQTCAIWDGAQFVALAERGDFDCRKYQDKVLRGDNGFMVPVRDVDALVIALRQYIEHPELVAEHGKWSRHYAEHYYDVHKVNQRMLEILGLEKVG